MLTTAAEEEGEGMLLLLMTLSFTTMRCCGGILNTINVTNSVSVTTAVHLSVNIDSKFFFSLNSPSTASARQPPQISPGGFLLPPLWLVSACRRPRLFINLTADATVPKPSTTDFSNGLVGAGLSHMAGDTPSVKKMFAQDSAVSTDWVRCWWVGVRLHYK